LSQNYENREGNPNKKAKMEELMPDLTAHSQIKETESVELPYK